MTLLTVALATFFLVSIVKNVLPVTFLPATSLGVVGLVSAGFLLLYSYEPWPVVAFAAGGAAGIVHGLHKLLQASGDERRVETLSK